MVKFDDRLSSVVRPMKPLTESHIFGFRVGSIFRMMDSQNKKGTLNLPGLMPGLMLGPSVKAKENASFMNQNHQVQTPSIIVTPNVDEENYENRTDNSHWENIKENQNNFENSSEFDFTGFKGMASFPTRKMTDQELEFAENFVKSKYRDRNDQGCFCRKCESHKRKSKTRKENIIEEAIENLSIFERYSDNGRETIHRGSKSSSITGRNFVPRKSNFRRNSVAKQLSKLTGSLDFCEFTDARPRSRSNSVFRRYIMNEEYEF